jgi:aryl-alcohol dehydrogenase-like predicted oxidoreductase
VNYRFQRSERAIGAAIARLAASGVATRAEIVVATKGGFVPFDGSAPGSAAAARAYVERTYFVTGVCAPEQMTRSLQHCMAPRYLEDQIGRSLGNLGVDSLDVYYIHNPETELPEVGRPEFERRIRAAFEQLEAEVAAGRVGRYGTATWNGFRAAPSAPEYMSLERLAAIAREVAGDDHHFRVVQMPFNLAMPEAFAQFNQTVEGEPLSPLEAAGRLGISVVASASLMQARLTGELPEEVVTAFEASTGAQRALQFARSAPGVASALAGMSRTAHVRENLGLLSVPPAPEAAVRDLFEE